MTGGKSLKVFGLLPARWNAGPESRGVASDIIRVIVTAEPKPGPVPARRGGVRWRPITQIHVIGPGALGPDPRLSLAPPHGPLAGGCLIPRAVRWNLYHKSTRQSRLEQHSAGPQSPHQSQPEHTDARTNHCAGKNWPPPTCHTKKRPPFSLSQKSPSIDLRTSLLAPIRDTFLGILLRLNLAKYGLT